jgi:hypothetical protein
MVEAIASVIPQWKADGYKGQCGKYYNCIYNHPKIIRQQQNAS